MITEDIGALSRDPTRQRALLSVVVPAYNESDVLVAFHRRLAAVLDGLAMDAEILFVDDGSRDDTLAVIRRLREFDRRVGVIALSRNFGKEVALTAGLDHAHGDAVVVIDADLQDPPELIPQLIEHWHEGCDVVYAKRASRGGETFFKRVSAHVFYRLIQRFSQVGIPTDTGDFRLLSRRAVDALKKLREQHRFMKGLFAWIGYPQKAVTYRRDARVAGHTKWNYWKLWNLALDGITSFTTAPLKAATCLGLVVTAAALLYAGLTLYHAICGDPANGNAALILVVLFLGGVQLICIGVIGEYLGRMFDEAKHRPLYLIDCHEPARVRRVNALPDRMRAGGNL